MGKYKINFLIIGFLSFLSCKTIAEPEKEISLNNLIIDEIDNYISDFNLFKAFQILTYYEEKYEDPSFLSISKDKLLGLFPVELNRQYENGDWENFFVTYNNLFSLGYNLEEYDINRIIFNYLIENIDSKLYKSGVLFGEEKLDYSKLSNDELKILLDKYSIVAPSDDFPHLLSIFEERGINFENNYSKDNYIDGLITIYVDNGIAFKNGVGTKNLTVGSGFFIDKNGYAVTNNHVIETLVDPEYEGVANLYIKLNGSVDKIPAKVIGWDPVLDLALIKVAVKPQYVYSFSEDYSLDVGEKVIALGSPGGLGSTVTSGIVSAVDRTFLEMGSVIQIDSPINPGNSGGPLIDEENRVTNVVFAGIEEFEGVNFAIPVKYLSQNLGKLYEGGRVEHSWLGAGIILRKKQLEIVYIKPDTPAYYLGLQKHDILTSINGATFETVLQVQDYLMKFSPKEIVTIEYIRDGQPISKQIGLDSRPEVIMNSIVEGDSADHLYTPLFGMDIKYSGKILWNREYLINDVYPGTIADELDLQSGDIIEVKKWEYNKEYEAVILQFVIQSKKEGFWKKSIQVVASINVNFFI